MTSLNIQGDAAHGWGGSASTACFPSPQLLCRRYRPAPSFGAGPGVLFLAGIPPPLEHIHGVLCAWQSPESHRGVDPRVLFITKHRFLAHRWVLLFCSHCPASLFSSSLLLLSKSLFMPGCWSRNWNLLRLPLVQVFFPFLCFKTHGSLL